MTRNGHEGQDFRVLADVLILVWVLVTQMSHFVKTLQAEIYLHTFLIACYTSIKSFKNSVFKKLKYNTWSLTRHMGLLFKSLRKNYFSQIILFFSKQSNNTRLEEHSLKLARTVPLSHSKFTCKQPSSFFQDTVLFHRTPLPSRYQFNPHFLVNNQITGRSARNGWCWKAFNSFHVATLLLFHVLQGRRSRLWKVTWLTQSCTGVSSHTRTKGSTASWTLWCPKVYP